MSFKIVTITVALLALAALPAHGFDTVQLESFQVEGVSFHPSYEPEPVAASDAAGEDGAGSLWWLPSSVGAEESSRVAQGCSNFQPYMACLAEAQACYNVCTMNCWGFGSSCEDECQAEFDDLEAACQLAHGHCFE